MPTSRSPAPQSICWARHRRRPRRRPLTKRRPEMPRHRPEGPRRRPGPRPVERSGPGGLISRARLALDLSAEQFGELVGKNTRTVSRWEANAMQISPETWRLIHVLLERHGDGHAALLESLPVPDSFRGWLSDHPAPA